MQLPNPDVRPHWVPFIRVENVTAIIDQAVEIGAKLIGEAQKTAHGDMAALLLDPTGSPIIVLQLQD
jgi:predicted enzyme related to lactoylglutathione lyase